MVKKKKEIHASIAVLPPSAKVTATVQSKCLVKMEKALNLSNVEKERDHIPIIFITVCNYNCFI